MSHLNTVMRVEGEIRDGVRKTNQTAATRPGDEGGESWRNTKKSMVRRL